MAPVISVVVVAKNEEKKIAGCLSSIEKQEGLDRDDYEILLVDGGSEDNTVTRALEVSSRLRVIRNPGSSISSNRNKGWRSAKGKYVAFLDADCVASRHWLKNLHKAIEYSGAAAVGSFNIPPENTSSFYDALKIMLDTYVGSRGSVQGRRPEKAFQCEHLPGLNILLDKTALDAVGGYDEAFRLVGEDEDLSLRLRDAGYKLWYTPDAGVWHYQRDTLKRWALNMFTYGKGRVWLLNRHPGAFSGVFLLPLLALFFFPIYFPLIGLYALMISLLKLQPNHFFRLWGLYVSTHVFYAIGMLYGLYCKGDTSEAKRRNRQPKLFLMALKNAGNIGDEAIVQSCVTQLRRLSEKNQYPIENMYLMGFGPSGMVFKLLPAFSNVNNRIISEVLKATNTSRKSGIGIVNHFERVLMLMAMRSRVLVCGGQWFHDLSRFNHFVITLLFFLVRFGGGKTGLFGVGVGPLRYAFSRWQMRLAFSAKSLLIVRDSKSQKVLASCQLSSEVGTDLVLGMESAPSSADGLPDIKGHLIGISPCAWTNFENLYNRDERLSEKTLKQLAGVIRGLLDRGKGVWLLPSMNPEDYQFSQLLKNKFNSEDAVKLIDTRNMSPSLFQSLVSKVTVLVSMRLHPLIFAVNCGVPFICFNYAEKVVQFSRQFSALEYMVDVNRSEWAAETLEKIDKMPDRKLLYFQSKKLSEHKMILAAQYEKLLTWYLHS